MKRKSILLAFLLMLACPVCFISCSDDDDKNVPITVTSNEEDQEVVQTVYTTTVSNPEKVLIQGGDGNYTVSCDIPAIADVEIKDNKWIEIRPLKIGLATITITDKSNNTYVFRVRVDMKTETIKVLDTRVYIQGDRLTEAEKEEIIQAAFKSTPVNKQGAYRFVYDKAWNAGTVNIFQAEENEEYTDAGFTFIPMENPSTKNGLYSYSIDIDGKQRIFTVFRYGGEMELSSMDPIKSKANIAPVYYYLKEDVTHLFKNQYPAVERVTTSQYYRSR